MKKSTALVFGLILISLFGGASFLWPERIAALGPFIEKPAEIAAWRAGPRDYTVRRWMRKNSKGEAIYHFTRPGWDSLVNSATVREGIIDRLTIFTVGPQGGS